ncbi:MAG: YihY/virulence factor BrkB family protein [Acidobacteria bacterium]|nr:YihY/virulence factor BrkB family protein [Acidobacteriota bacterium]
MRTKPFPAQVGGRFLAACGAAYRNNCLGIAKGAAYSSLLAIFPVLSSIAAILVQANAEAVSRTLADLLFNALPPGTENLLVHNFDVRAPRPITLLIGAALFAAWAGSGVMISLMEGFRGAYGIREGRPVVAQRAMAVFLVLLCAVPAVAASAAILFGRQTERTLLLWLGLLPAGEQLRGGLQLAGSVLRYATTLGSIVVVTAALYRFGPNRPGKNWREVWPGALVATILWFAATSAFGWYVRNVATYNVLYGSIGAVITFLVWTYVLAVVALVGCEFNAWSVRRDA